MVGEIFLARLHVPASAVEQFWDGSLAISNMASTMPGFIGQSIWCDLTDPESFLVVLETVDEASAVNIMQETVISSVFEKLQEQVEGTPTARWIKVRIFRGEPISSMPDGTFLSASLRTAEPGRAFELEQDYDMLFENLSYIDGYLGHANGPVNKLDEQMIGLVWWSTIEAYKSSLPNQTFYDIRLFRRVSSSEMHTAIF